MATFTEDIEDVINRHSREGDSNTPDFILARFLIECLSAWNHACRDRELFYGVDHYLGSRALGAKENAK